MLFIIIDDDSISAKLHERVIKHAYPDAETAHAPNYEAGLELLGGKNAYGGKIIVLTEIEIGADDCFQFADKVQGLPAAPKENIFLHATSSSIDKRDMMKVQNDGRFEYYLIKPITKEGLQLIVNVLVRRGWKNDWH